MAETLVEAVRRHEGHVHDLTHRYVATEFILTCGLVAILYSASMYAYGLLRPKQEYKISPPWYLQSAIWLALCAWAIFSQFKPDITWVARRFGRISFAVAVLAQIATFRPAFMPFTYTIGLIKVHKWIGRTAFAFSMLHGILYTVAYGRASKLLSLFHFRNFLGIIAATMFLAIFLSSLPRVRRRAYSTFYLLHFILTRASVLVLIFHCRPSAATLVEVSILVTLLQVIVRALTSKSCDVSKTSITTDLNLISIPREMLPSDFQPGSHLRISPPLSSWKAWLRPSHPYTIASPASANVVNLLVRKSNFKFEELRYSVWGPFNTGFNLCAYERVLIVAGGAGLSMLSAFQSASDNLPMQETRVRSVWITKSSEELMALDLLKANPFKVYLTGRPSDPWNDTAAQTKMLDEEASLANEFELESFDETTESGSLLKQNSSEEATPRQYNIEQGRPDLTALAAEFFEPNSDRKANCLVACGPERLVADAQNLAKQLGVSFYAEAFAI